MIRQAVGAIITRSNGDILLVEKVKWHDKDGNKINMEPEWDIPKGGVQTEDESLQSAIVRELKEETGSDEWVIEYEYDDSIYFTFPTYVQEKNGYKGQKTTIFRVRYIGEEGKFTPIDSEINSCQWVEMRDVIEKLSHEEMRQFFKSNVI